jgi:hypothetical protein
VNIMLTLSYEGDVLVRRYVYLHVCVYVYLFISSVCIDGCLYVFITYVRVCKHLRVFLSLCLYVGVPVCRLAEPLPQGRCIQ